MGANYAKPSIFTRKRARHAVCKSQDAAELRKAFKNYFGSDAAPKAKFIALYTKTHADDMKNPILKHLVRVLERKDGSIHFEDLYTAMRTVESGDKDSQLAWLFSFHDLDGDGQIDKFEMLEIVKTAYGILSRKDKDDGTATDTATGTTTGTGTTAVATATAESAVKSIANQTNDSKQQTLSAEERLRNTYCTAIDENSDGVLTRDEFINAYTLNSDMCCVIIKGINDLLQEIKSELLTAAARTNTSEKRPSCASTRNGK